MIKSAHRVKNVTHPVLCSLTRLLDFVDGAFARVQKFVCETRRAVAERAENIGIWFKILEMLAQLAVISNVRCWVAWLIEKIVSQKDFALI